MFFKNDHRIGMVTIGEYYLVTCYEVPVILTSAARSVTVVHCKTATVSGG
jgi:hypothetical protein